MFKGFLNDNLPSRNVMIAMEWLLGLVSRDQNEYVVIVQLVKNLYDFGFIRL